MCDKAIRSLIRNCEKTLKKFYWAVPVVVLRKWSEDTEREDESRISVLKVKFLRGDKEFIGDGSDVTTEAVSDRVVVFSVLNLAFRPSLFYHKTKANQRVVSWLAKPLLRHSEPA